MYRNLVSTGKKEKKFGKSSTATDTHKVTENIENPASDEHYNCVSVFRNTNSKTSQRSN